MQTAIKKFIIIPLLFLATISLSQTTSEPYLKSCKDITDPKARTECSKNKFAELLKEEFDKSGNFVPSNGTINIDLELTISTRGIIRIANYQSNYKIEKSLLSAITNIGYKVLMQPAIKDDIKVEQNVKYDIYLENYLPKGLGPRIIPQEQNDEPKRIPPTYEPAPEIFKVVENMPRFPGCENLDYSDREKEICAQDLMLEFLYDNLNPTQNGYDADIDGMHVLQFIVNEDGSLSNFDFVRSLGCKQCEDSIINVLKSMPTWIPGAQRNRKVKVLYTLPVKYKKNN